jgi:hypothetical protein
MFDNEPIRGGTRGGQAEFKWSDVSADKDREHYLGHSINAPTGRWQKNKDVHWYSRDQKDTDAERREEIRRVKEAEAEALSVALSVVVCCLLYIIHCSLTHFLIRGFAPDKSKSQSSPPSNANAVPVDKDKEERRKRKAERKAEKLIKKELKAQRKAERKSHHHHHHSDGDNYDDDERSYRRRDRERSRSPPHRRSHSPPRRRSRSRTPPQSSDYNERERERERDRERRLWDMNARRDRPSSRR